MSWSQCPNPSKPSMLPLSSAVHLLLTRLHDMAFALGVKSFEPSSFNFFSRSAICFRQPSFWPPQPPWLPQLPCYLHLSVPYYDASSLWFDQCPRMYSGILAHVVTWDLSEVGCTIGMAYDLGECYVAVVNVWETLNYLLFRIRNSVTSFSHINNCHVTLTQVVCHPNCTANFWQIPRHNVG